MNYLKCALGGCAASLLSGIVFIVISGMLSFSKQSDESFSEITIAFTAGPLFLIVLLAGFAIGFIWMLKRSSSSRLTS